MLAAGMPRSEREVAAAGEAAARILHEMCAHSFAYAVERHGGAWALRVECATGQGWQSFMLPVDPSELAASLRDARLRERLTATWTKRLRDYGACGLKPGGGAKRQRDR